MEIYRRIMPRWRCSCSDHYCGIFRTSKIVCWKEFYYGLNNIMSHVHDLLSCVRNIISCVHSLSSHAHNFLSHAHNLILSYAHNLLSHAHNFLSHAHNLILPYAHNLLSHAHNFLSHAHNVILSYAHNLLSHVMRSHIKIGLKHVSLTWRNTNLETIFHKFRSTKNKWHLVIYKYKLSAQVS